MTGIGNGTKSQEVQAGSSNQASDTAEQTSMDEGNASWAEGFYRRMAERQDIPKRKVNEFRVFNYRAFFILLNNTMLLVSEEKECGVHLLEKPFDDVIRVTLVDEI